jgi:predicted nucleic-acid-binding protein
MGCPQGMISVDTNVLARFLVKDDIAQWAKADALIRENDIFIPVSVVLELAWLLEKRYKIGRLEVMAVLDGLLASQRVEIGSATQVAMAVQFCRNGLDFADALHLSLSQDCEKLATFDLAFMTKSSDIGTLVGVSEP